ncbi:hypothetical protein F5X96DRAFT_395744 [Biscogniauxia mediterranea]|nr:hypothetical protein F5X96DRAFT_395744 [Biscogniauxia mediterranea]
MLVLLICMTKESRLHVIVLWDASVLFTCSRDRRHIRFSWGGGLYMLFSCLSCHSLSTWSTKHRKGEDPSPGWGKVKTESRSQLRRLTARQPHMCVVWYVTRALSLIFPKIECAFLFFSFSLSFPTQPKPCYFPRLVCLHERLPSHIGLISPHQVSFQRSAHGRKKEGRKIKYIDIVGI